MDVFICHYGCGRVAIKQNKSGNWMCDVSPSKCPENKKKNSLRNKEAYASGRRVDAKTKYNNLPEETKQKMSWSKGLTKHTNAGIAERAAAYSERSKGRKGRPHTSQSKIKMSKSRTAFLETRSKHCEWFSVAGIKVQGTLEKQFAEFLVSEGVVFERNKLTYQTYRTYTPDFYIPLLDIYVEVKGFLFEHDKEKMRHVLMENEIDLRIAFKSDILQLQSLRDVTSLATVKSHIEDIDYTKFTNHWDIEGNGIPPTIRM